MARAGKPKRWQAPCAADARFFFEEDSWIGGIQDTCDRNGRLYRVEWALLWPDYVKKAVLGGSSFPIFDLRTQLYELPIASRSWAMDKPLTTSRMHSESLTSFVLQPGGYRVDKRIDCHEPPLRADAGLQRGQLKRTEGCRSQESGPAPHPRRCAIHNRHQCCAWWFHGSHDLGGHTRCQLLEMQS